MISSLRGVVAEIGLDHVVLDIAGVGMQVFATPATLGGLRRGEQAGLATQLVVREDSLTLYGFAAAEERELFVLLQTVNGIGPRLALATLAVLQPTRLRAALAEGEHATLTQVPGIGKKVAERLVIELRDKVGHLDAADGGQRPSEPAPEIPDAAPAAGAVAEQVVEALVGLGFPSRSAERTVAELQQSWHAADGHAADGHAADGHAADGHAQSGATPAPAEPDSAQLLRGALASLGGRS